MQFVKQGPDIPERLLQLHEEGRVVFFCGAGISYPANLPGFSGLVKSLYEAVYFEPNDVQKAAIKAQKFDTAISLLESELDGGRQRVRSELAKILTPSAETLLLSKSTDTHDAILKLGKTRDGLTRVITTNFDRLFEQVIKIKSLNVPTFKSPFLPIPKNRFDGLVYLHGVLSEAASESEISTDHLVLSSGDFGLAYLTERWAARFVSELFRNYTVCFVGYSIADPVLRYMMDALAADRLLGENPPEMFAFGNFLTGQEEKIANEWKAKNVTPILYRDNSTHIYLHNTLKAWADTYHNGASGKEQIVIESAIAKPMASTEQDDFVGRMLWALSDKEGRPAKRFSELNPVPSLDWLHHLSKDIYNLIDLSRFGINTGKNDPDLTFSLINRPTPYRKASNMALVNRGGNTNNWDQVMTHLANWLTRHLDDIQLLLWIAKNGSQLHPEFARVIELRLAHLNDLHIKGKSEEIRKILLDAPNAVPGFMMKKLWGMLLVGRIKSHSRRYEIYNVMNKIKVEGFTISTKHALRDALTPFVSISEPIRFDSDSKEIKTLRDLVSWEIQLTSLHVHTPIRELKGNAEWQTELPSLLNDFHSLLKDALDLMFELKDPADKSDHTHITRPSISDHHQNNDHKDWTVLIELTRDAWLATASQNKQLSINYAQIWLNLPYPIFKRLAFFAAAQSNFISSHMALNFISNENYWWLWSHETQREMFRLIVEIAPRLSKAELTRLEKAILSGIPDKMFNASTDDLRKRKLSERAIWLRLKKLSDAGAALSEKAASALFYLSESHPEWRLFDNQKEEFPFWLETSWGGRPMEDFIKHTYLPTTKEGILDYLTEHPTLKDEEMDDWRERCISNYNETSYALKELSKKGIWPVVRWSDAIQAWSEEKLVKISWLELAPIILSAPDEEFQQLTPAIGMWLSGVSKEKVEHKDQLTELATRVIHLPIEYEHYDADPLDLAINHPVGKATQALLNRWYQAKLEDGQKIPPEFKPIFTELCDTNIDVYKHGRVILASSLVNLYRVDKAWTTEYLLPLFDWTISEEIARGSWQGFLWSARPYLPLLVDFKPALLETAAHYDRLDGHKENFASFLTFVAVESADLFKPTELSKAFRVLPLNGLKDVSTALANMLESSGNRREDFWKNRIKPFMERFWPRLSNTKLQETDQLSRLCIAAGNEFPAALKLINPMLNKSEFPFYPLHLLNETSICEDFPEPALRFLHLIIDANSMGIREELQPCLDKIAVANPNLATDPRFTRLSEIVLLAQH
jgi:hypothetical protein